MKQEKYNLSKRNYTYLKIFPVLVAFHAVTLKHGDFPATRVVNTGVVSTDLVGFTQQPILKQN